jgi:hypothetical protein
MKDHIISREEAILLFTLELQALGPTEPTVEYFNDFVNDYTGKTLWEFAQASWPEEPEEAYGAAIQVLIEMLQVYPQSDLGPIGV